VTPDEVRRRMPGAPEEAIKQISAYAMRHAEFLASGCRDINILLDTFEEYFALIRRWNPDVLEREIQRAVADIGRIICKGNKACTDEFESTLRKLVQLSDIK
jgi:hypothetical protein